MPKKKSAKKTGKKSAEKTKRSKASYVKAAKQAVATRKKNRKARIAKRHAALKKAGKKIGQVPIPVLRARANRLLTMIRTRTE